MTGEAVEVQMEKKPETVSIVNHAKKSMGHQWSETQAIHGQHSRWHVIQVFNVGSIQCGWQC